MEVTFRPIDVWPGELTKYRKSSPFKASYSDTLVLLDRELVALKAKRIVVQLAVTEGEIRLDGMPRADAKVQHPGVILAFDSKHGPLKYATDIFDGWYRQVGWQANLRAIALGLEALRKVDRYGITKRGEQYTGWKALGGGIAMGPTMSKEDAARWMVDQLRAMDGHSPIRPESIIVNPEIRRAVFRDLAKRLHPDVDGTTEKFQKLDECKRLIEA